MREYNGGLTREQFLFYEIRMAAKLLTEGFSREEAIQKIKDENLFQFPTERMIESIAKTCFKRIEAMDNSILVENLAEASFETAKQINLYAMMRDNGIVWDFMTTVIGEKFRTQDFELSVHDLNRFFLKLSEQNDQISGWSEATVKKIKQVLKKSLIECDYLDSSRSTILNPVCLCAELEAGIRANDDTDAFPAFNFFG